MGNNTEEIWINYALLSIIIVCKLLCGRSAWELKYFKADVDANAVAVLRYDTPFYYRIRL